MERTAYSGDGFTGVWRVREYNADQQRVADEIIIGPIGEHLADASAAADYARIAAATGGIDEWRLYRA